MPGEDVLPDMTDYLTALGDNAVLLETAEEIRGAQAYRIDMTVSGETLSATAGLLPMPEKGKIDWKNVQLNGTLWLDTETKLPLRWSMKLASPIRSGELTISGMEILADYTGFDTVESITVPPEAKAAPAVDGVANAVLPG